MADKASPTWPRVILTAIVSALCAGALVAGICVWAFTPRPIPPPDQPTELPPPLLPSGAHASDEGQGTALDGDANELPLTEPQPSVSMEGHFLHAAVSVDSVPCADVGRDILAKHGTAVDAAIGALVCNGVANPHSMGLGGGFLMTIYLANGTAVSLVAREMAPMAATREMFAGERSSKLGPGASGVPGELKGYWEAKEKFGNPALTWPDLLKPTIDLCENGITVSAATAKAIKLSESHIRADPGLKELLINPTTDGILVEGDIYRNPTLAATLHKFSEGGAAELYEGETGRQLVEDMRAAGGLMTVEDLAKYRTSWEEPVQAEVRSASHTDHVPGAWHGVLPLLGTTAWLRCHPGRYPRPGGRLQPDPSGPPQPAGLAQARGVMQVCLRPEDPHGGLEPQLQLPPSPPSHRAGRQSDVSLLAGGDSCQDQRHQDLQ